MWCAIVEKFCSNTAPRSACRSEKRSHVARRVEITTGSERPRIRERMRSTRDRPDTETSSPGMNGLVMTRRGSGRNCTSVRVMATDVIVPSNSSPGSTGNWFGTALACPVSAPPEARVDEEHERHPCRRAQEGEERFAVPEPEDHDVRGEQSREGHERRSERGAPRQEERHVAKHRDRDREGEQCGSNE